MPSNANETEAFGCVCGMATTQRCGAFQEAGFDLFFCSREHQKLVWFAHKRVCGSNAKPFRFPALTNAEAARLQEGKFELGTDTHDNVISAMAKGLNIAPSQVPKGTALAQNGVPARPASRGEETATR
ncbi:hypothetical protein JCM8547_004828 [Rhodosporidiobolus lusitaniae]